jgi:hypothetical protein
VLAFKPVDTFIHKVEVGDDSSSVRTGIVGCHYYIASPVQPGPHVTICRNREFHAFQVLRHSRLEDLGFVFFEWKAVCTGWRFDLIRYHESLMYFL